jgi:hypothetical protein
LTNKNVRELVDALRKPNTVRQGQSLTGINDSTLGNLLQVGNFEKEVTDERLKDGLTLGAMKKIDKVLATAQAKVRKIA